MSKHVLILGAGLVSQPIIDYLFEKTDYTLTIADIEKENAVKAIKDNPKGQAVTLDVNNADHLGQLVTTSDIVISLLPLTLHGIVANHCLEHGKSMVNASYVSDTIREMDDAARRKDILFLCEMGVDPGIDHMSAMEIIDDIRKRGGKIKEFVSVCGGLPAPDSNNNPYGYKFSWSPKGVLMAGKSSARYIEGGEVKEVSSNDLFHSTSPLMIDGLEFESYPNRDSISYEDSYGFRNIDLLLRGTLRYTGWHKHILAFKDLHLLEDTPILEGESSYAAILAELNNFDKNDIRNQVARKLDMAPDNEVVLALEWLGLFNHEPEYFKKTTAIDALARLMSKRMAYEPGEQDMIAMQHRFLASFEDHKERITSTLFDYGIPGGNSSMARTVSLPIAIITKLILEGEISLRGVRIPVDPMIYKPVLAELKTLGIVFKEEVVVIDD